MTTKYPLASLTIAHFSKADLSVLSSFFDKENAPKVQAIESVDHLDLIANGSVQILLFTSLFEVDELVSLIRQQNRELELRRSLHPVVIVCLGEEVIFALKKYQLFPDSVSFGQNQPALKAPGELKVFQ